jgi:hypothetical protein
MIILATLDDVSNRWRPLSDAETLKVETLLGDASALLRAEFPGIDTTIDSGGLDATIVASVVAQMVKRAMLAPSDGIQQESETAGPYSHSQQYANPMGNVFLTAAERTLILGRQPEAMSVQFG